MRLYFLLPLAVVLFSCNSGQKPGRTIACAHPVKTELYFGLNMDSTATVSEAQFTGFVYKHLVSANIGLTILNSEGRWLNTKTGTMDKENSKLVILVYNSCDTAVSNTIARAVRAYNAAFSQQSVLRVDYPVSYSFIEER